MISTTEGIGLYTVATGLVDEFIPEEELAVEAFSAAVQAGHPVYALLYLVAARRFGCVVVTLDRRLSSLAPAMNLTTVGA